MSAGMMLLYSVACYVIPEPMIRIFSSDYAVIGVGAEYLRIVSWSLVASGIVFVNGSMFQAMGNTIPPLVASFARILVVLFPAILLARMQGFELRWLWYLSVAATVLQLAINLLLLRREFQVRLRFDPAPIG
jgi:Na+-driven multidrug efflux pump